MGRNKTRLTTATIILLLITAVGIGCGDETQQTKTTITETKAATNSDNENKFPLGTESATKEPSQSNDSEENIEVTPVRIGDSGLVIRGLKFKYGEYGGRVDAVMFNESDVLCKAALNIDLLNETGKVISNVSIIYEDGLDPGEEATFGERFVGIGVTSGIVTWTSCKAGGRPNA